MSSDWVVLVVLFGFWFGGEFDFVDWEVAAPEREVERVCRICDGGGSISMLPLPGRWFHAVLFAISRSIDVRRL